MKRSIRILSLILLSALLLISFTSCMSLDDMKAAHAFYDENGAILYDGHTYYLLPECSELTVSELDSINVTETDVPVLLSGTLGDSYDVSPQKIFLSMYYKGKIYCREDYFEDVKNRIENGYTMDRYCFMAMIDPENTGDPANSYVDYELLKPKVASVLLDTMEIAEPMILPSAGMKYEQIIRINRCSEDTFFQSYAFDLRISEGIYYVAVTDSVQSETAYYRISDEDLPLIQNTFYHAA